MPGDLEIVDMLVPVVANAIGGRRLYGCHGAHYTNAGLSPAPNRRGAQACTELR
jgi:hypothetical protein